VVVVVVILITQITRIVLATQMSWIHNIQYNTINAVVVVVVNYIITLMMSIKPTMKTAITITFATIIFVDLQL